MNNKTKLFYMGRRINGQFDSFKMRVRRFVRTLIRTTAVAAILVFAFTIGAATFSTTTSAVSNTTTLIPVDSPVLDRISDCESGDGTKGSATHYDHNGQVLLRANKNGTVDVGKYQVNSVWFKKATELGFDITTEKDNEAFAEWLYLNKGTTDWSASQKCWYHN